MENRPLTVEEAIDLMWLESSGQPTELNMSIETKDMLGVVVNAPGYQNKSKRRRIRKQFEKYLRKQDRRGGGLSRYLTGE